MARMHAVSSICTAQDLCVSFVPKTEGNNFSTIKSAVGGLLVVSLFDYSMGMYRMWTYMFELVDFGDIRCVSSVVIVSLDNL